MRGNELENSKLANAEVEFPIPMRGNEEELREARYAARQVSDPHEG